MSMTILGSIEYGTQKWATVFATVPDQHEAPTFSLIPYTIIGQLGIASNLTDPSAARARRRQSQTHRFTSPLVRWRINGHQHLLACLEVKFMRFERVRYSL